MKQFIKYIFYIIFSAAILSSCMNSRKLVTDEIVLKDGNSQTGTIQHCDSINLKIKKMDESITIIPWTTVDTIIGKKLKTIWFGANFGYYKTPYFSVFRDESMIAKQWGMQYKIGLALRGVKLYYIDLSYSPAKPYAVTKVGLGFQRYLGGSTYLKKNTFFVGTEVNFMNAKYNNGAQVALEPFTGFEKKLNEHLRVHFKFGLQLNIANKNNQAGFNATIGIHFLKRNFKLYYDVLNDERRIYRK